MEKEKRESEKRGWRRINGPARWKDSDVSVLMCVLSLCIFSVCVRVCVSVCVYVSDPPFRWHVVATCCRTLILRLNSQGFGNDS